MTWSHWFVTPAFTSLFFLLGVLTLYWFITNQIIHTMKKKGHHPSIEKVRANVGVIYIILVLVAVQINVHGTADSWVFSNFLIFAIVFVSYFLMLQVHFWQMLLGVLFFMVINGTILIPLSWVYASVYLGFFYTMKLLREHRRTGWLAYFDYTLATLIFSTVLWAVVGLRFHLQMGTLAWEILFCYFQLAVMYIYVNSLMSGANTLAELTYTTNYDELTHVKNYFAFKNEFSSEFAAAKLQEQPLTLMLFDIDHFKHVNDTYGHLTGDYVLSHVAQLIATQLKTIDSGLVLYRTGGEEFTILFNNYTADQAREHVAAIAENVREATFHHNDHDIDISISVGVTQMQGTDEGQVDIYKRADQNLYYSKRHGRDQVTFS
ncbi:GGDEF domain-containing protein [Levilactobacillus enshiensis]|uniref:GGDEF domain-containing protein n=1 Tax=Levilactobacillus enshiensis TaxID=2590213 RepID=UPI00117BA6F8|nr:GGDEF domain-containing protein [Levilactobacillus enshiensis]